MALCDSLCHDFCKIRIPSLRPMCLIHVHRCTTLQRRTHPSRVNRRAICVPPPRTHSTPTAADRLFTDTSSVAGESLSNTCPSFIASRSRTLKRFRGTPARIVIRICDNVSHEGCSSIRIIHGAAAHPHQIQIGVPHDICTAVASSVPVIAVSISHLPLLRFESAC